mgnify:CR=1 FL=1
MELAFLGIALVQARLSEDVFELGASSHGDFLVGVMTHLTAMFGVTV